MKHPCPYSEPLVSPLINCVRTATSNDRILDPMAGSGFFLDILVDTLGYQAVGVDLDIDWSTSPLVLRGDATRLPFADGSFGCVVVSPTYANRLADKDKRPSVACTYMKALDREASAGSSCHLQWGTTKGQIAYKNLHSLAWWEVWRVLEVGGGFVLNVKDHYRGEQLQPVVAWHHQQVMSMPFTHERRIKVPCSGMQRGTNRKRVEFEEINVYKKAA